MKNGLYMALLFAVFCISIFVFLIVILAGFEIAIGIRQALR